MKHTRTALAALAIATLTACTGPVPATWNNSRDLVAKVSAPAEPAPAAPAATPSKPVASKPADQKPATQKPAGFTKPANPQRPLATRSPQAPR